MTANDPQLIDDSVTMRLTRMIFDLNSEQRLSLLKQIEEMSVLATLKDKRGHSRKPLAMTVSFSCEGRLYSGITNDMSNSGMFIQTKGDFSVGQDIELSMPFRDRQKPLQSLATIIRVEPIGIGVQLLKTR